MSNAMAVLDGLRWSLSVGKITEADSFQADDGRPVGYAKLGWFGGGCTVALEPEEVPRLRAFIGKFVTMSGELSVDGKKKATLRIGEIKEVKLS